MSDTDRENWQAEQVARDEAQTAYYDKMARARERSAANAKRKIARLHAKLTELGHISEFEDEFGESVLERLDKFGSAFNDREKGRAGDALSIAQKQVVARMKKKLKDIKAKQDSGQSLEPDPDADYVRTADRWKKSAQDSPKRNGFKSKRGSKFTPRVRRIEDEIMEEETAEDISSAPKYTEPPKLVSIPAASQANLSDLDRAVEPYIPEYVPPVKAAPKKSMPSSSTGAKRPFLRLVPKAE